ncbi:hypothetical protein [Falsirhodobacter halotolerans]|uniref:hypothetical protein n=1 Tax=Falsirhodobacter halotolerans TaxID=1146892 RepID=UPI001FD4B0C8|nr:hypothetical protein [Falsirhodobacter halotolerans]MCJ8138615.1 hypothetical protein [Falsirhodobacter halotolerans]
MSVQGIVAQNRELKWHKEQLEHRCLTLGITLDEMAEKLALANARIKELGGEPIADTPPDPAPAA